MRMKEESEKAGLKFSTQKTKIMASNPIASWQIEGKNVEAVIDFLFFSSKITVDDACSHEVGKRLLLGRKAKRKLDCVKQQRYHFANKDTNGQGYGLSSSHIQLWELEHKEGRAPKNWSFWTVVLEKTLESPLDNKEINPEYSLQGLMLKLKLQYFGHLMWTANSLEKTLMLGKIEGRGKESVRVSSEDEKVGWHYWCSGHELGQTLGDIER